MSSSERRTDRKHHPPRRNYPLLSWHPLFFLLCLLLLPIPAYAQEPGPTTWEWRTFTADNSPLAPGGVNQLMEDSQGRIWVGTSYYKAGAYMGSVSLYQSGIWQTFAADNSPLARGWVNVLLEDSQGRIWVRTDEGVSLFQDGAWQTFRVDSLPLGPGKANVLLEDSQGRIWVKTWDGVSLYQDGVWQTFTADNSPLASGAVNALLEDSQGRVWVGIGYFDQGTRTYRGKVSFYQGDTWQAFTAENSHLAPGWANVLLEDSQGRLWAGTDQGVSLFQDGVWQTFTTDNFPLAPGEVNVLLEDSQGHIWVGTSNGVSLHQRGAWQTFTAEDSPLVSGPVNVLLEDSQGRAWVGTNHGVSFYQRGVWQTFTAEDSPLAPGWVNVLLEDSHGRVWVGTRNGVSLYRARAWQTFTAETSPLAPGWVNVILEDSQGRVWVGTQPWEDIGSGISVYQRDAWQTFTVDNSPLAPGGVWQLLEDSQGRIWVGTSNGVSLHQKGAWQTFTAEDSPLVSGPVNVLLEDSQGRVWVGTNNGVSFYQRDVWQTFTAEDSPLAPGPVNVLLEDSQGRVWVGTSYSQTATNEGSVSFYQSSVWQTFTADNSPLAPGWVNVLLEDSHGRIWVGTTNGVSLYRRGAWQTFTAEDSPLASGWVDVLLEDSQDRIWVGTWGGVSLYQAGAWQTFTADNSSLAPGEVWQLLEDSQGRIWVGAAWRGTEGNVNFYKDGAWQTFTAGPSPLAPGQVNALLEDSQGRIWVATDQGISLFQDGVWQTFTADNSPLASGWVDVLLEDAQGHIWVGTDRGISMRHAPGDQPCVFLRYAGPTSGQPTSLRATAALTFTFSSPHSTLLVGFSGIDAESDPDRLLFRCQLLGYEDEEVPCASPVRYPALPPGTYTFRVRVLDEDLMSSEPATATFTLISTAPATPTPTLPPTQTPALTSTPRIIEVERVVPGLPREAVIPLVGGLGGLTAVVVFGAMMLARVRRARALRRGFNPYEAGRPILDPHRFFGREALIAQVLNTIHQNDVLIHGERRIGKTSLLRQLEHRLRAMDDPDYQFIPVYADVEGVPQAEFFHLLMEEIVVTCRKAGHTPPALRFTGKAAADYTYRDFLHDLQSLLEVPQAASHRTIRLILLLDEVDVMNGYDQLVQQQFRRILMKRFAQQVGVVASGVHVFREWSREESPFRNLFVEIHLGTMEEEAARRLITEPVKGIYSYDDEAVDLILCYSEHKPWRVQRLCLEVVNRLLADRRTRVTRQDVEEVHRRMLSEETEWAVPQGEYPALVPASLPAAEAETEYRAQSEEDRDA
jgi:ligand-binding sensor domain-containing protein